MLREQGVFNGYETHIVIHLHNNRTWERSGTTEMKYVNVVRRDEEIPLLVTMGCGCREKFPEGQDASVTRHKNGSI